MDEVFIMCRSVTHAQRGKKLLEQNGLSAVLRRAPAGASKEGCAYCLKMRPAYLAAALKLLRPYGLCTGRAVRLMPDGSYAEAQA